MQRKTIYLIFFIFLAGSFTQLGANETLEQLEREMIQHQNGIARGDGDEAKQKASDEFRKVLIEALNFEGCFDYPFDGIKTMSILTSPDEAFRIFNWNVPHVDETHDYYCFILHRDKKDKSTAWEELVETNSDALNIENKYLKPDSWMGALYYKIIPIKVSKKKVNYTLLGWDGNNRSSTKKIIDVITFDNGKTRMGAPIFKMEKGTQKRFIIEYSSEVVVSLKWHKKEKRIVFDHVAPKDPFMTGVYSQYGPDMTYDAFVLEKGKWIFQSNVEVVNPKSNIKYNDPRK